VTARGLVDEARAALRAGDVRAALSKFAAAAEQAPGDADAPLGQGVCCARLGRLDDAIAHFERAVAISASPPAMLALANALADAGRGDEAVARAEELARAHPAFAPGWNALGAALARCRRPDDAARAYEQALRADAGYWRAAASLARLHAARGDLEAAAGAYRRWVAIDPASFDAQLGFARVRHRQARVPEAIALYRAALAIRDDDADAHNDLGNAYTDIAEIDAAQAEFRRALDIRPDYAEVHSNLLLNLHYGAGADAGAMFDAHAEWARRHADVAPIELSATRVRGASQPIRIGLVGATFASGPVGSFVEPLVARIDRRRFDVVCYANHPFRDDVAHRIASRASAWRDASALDDAALAARIVDDRIDIVVDLAGHTPGNRLRALARKPARLVATWLDYFDTTGVPAVDCLLADPITVPEGTRQRFTERVIRFARCRLCYAPPPYAPDVAESRRPRPTFASFNRLSKVSADVRALWARVLHAVPGSTLILKNAAFADAGVRELFASRFAALGIAPERLDLRAASPHPQMLREYADVDVALDPFPYNGGLTTCEALWMGVPVICLAGDSMIARQSASLVAAAGFAECAAGDADDYVALAVAAAQRMRGRDASRRGMRERVRASVLCDAAAFARNWERALVDAWQA
jgi:predicted O-linked N-acetylglucosamine transferase (SPINDLY family)